jgi:hypothetical protein
MINLPVLCVSANRTIELYKANTPSSSKPRAPPFLDMICTCGLLEDTLVLGQLDERAICCTKWDLQCCVLTACNPDSPVRPGAPFLFHIASYLLQCALLTNWNARTVEGLSA